MTNLPNVFRRYAASETDIEGVDNLPQTHRFQMLVHVCGHQELQFPVKREKTVITKYHILFSENRDREKTKWNLHLSQQTPRSQTFMCSYNDYTAIAFGWRFSPYSILNIYGCIGQLMSKSLRIARFNLDVEKLPLLLGAYSCCKWAP